MRWLSCLHPHALQGPWGAKLQRPPNSHQVRNGISLNILEFCRSPTTHWIHLPRYLNHRHPRGPFGLWFVELTSDNNYSHQSPHCSPSFGESYGTCISTPLLWFPPGKSAREISALFRYQHYPTVKWTATVAWGGLDFEDTFLHSTIFECVHTCTHRYLNTI